MNIHLTGCHHSCAQHYIGDIGLHRRKVQTNDEGDTVEGYPPAVGGGFGPDGGMARELYRDVKAEDVPATVERMLRAYLARRASADETFHAFTRRHDIDALDAYARGGRGMTQQPAVRPSPASCRRTRRSRRSSAPGSTASSPACLLDGDAVTRCRPQDAAAADARRRDRRGTAMTTTATRPGTTRPCRCAERMKLAEGRPLRRKLMAAMGQQDCGQCGYNCETMPTRSSARRKSGSTSACPAARKPPAC